MERELTQEEASGYLGRGLDFAGNSGWLRHWFDLAQMVRDTGGSGAIRETFCWDSPARMARLWGSQDGRLVAGFRGRPWARLSCDAADRSWGVVAEGRVELSEPTREPGDVISRSAGGRRRAEVLPGSRPTAQPAAPGEPAPGRCRDRNLRHGAWFDVRQQRSGPCGPGPHPLRNRS